MSDYMAQKADQQIEAGLSERESLIVENQKLRADLQIAVEAMSKATTAMLEPINTGNIFEARLLLDEALAKIKGGSDE